MAITADQVVVELEAKVADYNRKVVDAERKFDRSMGRMEGSAKRMERGVGLAFKGMAAAVGAIGLLNLGRQAVQTALDFRRVETAMATATGSTEAAGVQFEFLRDLAERLGLRFITLADTYTGFAAAARGTNIEGRQTQEIFEAITTAVVATGGSMEQAEGALRAVEQMVSKGNVSAEELRGQLGERLPGAFQIAARAMGVTTQELGKMLEKGELVADEFLPRFATQLRSELPTSVETADAAFQRFQTALDDIANSTADGFMQELGTATDDLTTILKDMQASGALEAFGAFLGDIIRLGGAAVQTLGQLIQKANELQNSGPLQAIELAQAQKQAKHGLTEGIRRRGRSRVAVVFGSQIASGVLGESTSSGSPVGAFGTADFLIEAQRRLLDAGSRTGGGGGGGGAKGNRAAEKAAREAERAAEEARRNQEAFDRELFQAQQDGIRAQQDLADSSIDRAAIERELLTRATAQAEKEIQADERYTQAQKDALVTILQRNAYLEADLINKEEGQRLAREAADLEDARLQLGMDLLGLDADLARTAGDRRAIELRLVELAFERERVQLEGLAADKSATEAARQAARERLEALPRLQAGAEAGVRQRTQSPLAAYLNSLPQSAAEANEALEAIAANGLQSVTDGLAEVMTGAKSLGDVFSSVADQIIADLIRIALQQAVVAAFGGGGGPNIGSLNSMIASNNAALLAGLAGGGSIFVRGRGGLDRNVMSINGTPVARVNQGERIDVVPQGRAISPINGPALAPGVGSSAIAKVQVELSGDIDGRIVSVSGPVAVEVVRASTPGIVRSAAAETSRALSRPRL